MVTGTKLDYLTDNKKITTMIDECLRAVVSINDKGCGWGFMPAQLTLSFDYDGIVSDDEKKEFENLVNKRLKEEDFTLKVADENNEPYHSIPKTFTVKNSYKSNSVSHHCYMRIEFDTTRPAYIRYKDIMESFKLCTPACHCGGQLIKNNKCNKYVKELLAAHDKYIKAHFEYLKIKEKSDRCDEEHA
jgi:hypothetical protein